MLIVGGGTAGWLSAAYLNRALGQGVDITLVESSDVPTIGVGEATIPTLRMTFDFLGMDEDEWLPKCNATFKTAIKFVNWTPRQGEDGFFHPFFNRSEMHANPFERAWFPEVGAGFSLWHYWLKRRLDGDTTPLAYALYEATTLCDLGKAPRTLDDPRHAVVSAYHFDAGLLAAYLRKLATARGVHHVVDHVVDIRVDESGLVTSLGTRSGRQLEADLFIDCTGFRGALINKTLNEPFISDKPSLFCDAAVAIPTRNDPETDGIRPYTLATALERGWVWDVPLYHRNGCGYVYCSDFASKDEAEAELRAHLGPRCDGMPARHIRMRVGRTRSPWKANCIAIGLSSCFLEPLESTGIFLIEYQLQALVSLFPDRRFESGLIRQYNRIVRTMYEELRDFIVLHYVAGGRHDTAFWRAVASDTHVPDTLAGQLEMYRSVMPVKSAIEGTVFRGPSLACILAGMDYLPKAPYPILEQLDYEAGERALADIRARTQELAERLPDQYELLRTLHYRDAENPYESGNAD